MLHDNNRFLSLLFTIILCSSLGAEASLPPYPAGKTTTTKKTSSSKSSQKQSGKTTSKKSAQKHGGKTGSPKPSQMQKSPQTSAEAKRRQEETQREIARTKEQIRLNEQQMKEGLSDLNRLSADIQSGRKNVAQLQGKVASLQNEIGTLNSKIEQGEKELVRMREEYLKAVKKMRLTKKNQSTLAFIFASENFNQAMRRIRYLRQFSQWKERQSANINAQIKTLADEKQRLDQARQQESTALAQLESSQRTLEGQHREQAKLVDKLKANGDMLQGHLRSKQAEANSLKESISRLIAEEQAKERARIEAERKAKEKAAAERAEAERIAREKAAAEKAAADNVGTAPGASASDKKAAEKAAADKKKEDKKKAQERKAQEKKQKNSEKSSRRKKKSSGENVGTHQGASDSDTPAANAPAAQKPAADQKLGSSFAASKGSLPRPVDGGWRITNPFGRHSMPEMPEVVYDNPGIDAEVANGATAKAVYAGRVSGVYKVAGYGTVVIVNHGDYYTVYGNLSSVSVSVGTQVKPGQALGKVGPDPDDPRHSSIHFEVWHGRDKQNPSSWLR